MGTLVLNTFVGMLFLLTCATGANAQAGWFLLGVTAGQSNAQEKSSSRTIITKNVGDLKMTVFYQRQDIADKILLKDRGSIRVISKKITAQGKTAQELFENASKEDLNRSPWTRRIFDAKDYALLGAGLTPDPEGTTQNTYTFWYIEKGKLKKED